MELAARDPVEGFWVLMVLVDRASVSSCCGYTSCELVATNPGPCELSSTCASIFVACIHYPCAKCMHMGMQVAKR